MSTRWEELFADLAGQVEDAEARELAGEVVEATRAQWAELTLVARAAGALGSEVRVQVSSGAQREGATVTGRLADVAAEWLLVTESPGRSALVAWSAVVAMSGLGRASAGGDVRRLGLRVALRGVARDRSGVRVRLADGSTVTGTIDRVGRDFLEIGEHPLGELRRVDQVQSVRTVPFAAIAVVAQISG